MMKLYLISSTAGEFEWLEQPSLKERAPPSRHSEGLVDQQSDSPGFEKASFIAFKAANICCRERWRFVRFVRFGLA